MSTPYLPPQDALFLLWLANFSSVAAASPVIYGLNGGQVTAIQTADIDFAAAYTLAIDPGTRTPTTVAAKDTARTNAEAVVRPICVTISRSAAISNGDKTSIGVTVPTVVPTPVPAPVTAPVIALSSAVVGLLNLFFRDSTSPTVRAKPSGVKGCELWASVGTVPAVSPQQCSFMGMFTKTPLQLPTGLVGGKVVTVFARWANGSGPGGVASVGPWSAPLTTFSL